MKRLALFLITTLFAGISVAGVKYVAVLETEIDASAKIAWAEAHEVTEEIRRQAVKNLPREKYSIMTAETVIAQDVAFAAECNEENCTITLGRKIGADYVVRGTIRKIQTRFTLSVVIYNTDNETLVASSDPVRSEKITALIENAAGVCGEMFRGFVDPSAQNAPAQSYAQPVPPPPAAIPPVNPSPAPSAYNDNTVGIETVFVKGGTFKMGCTAEQGSDCESDEKPAHSVTVSDFYIGKYEVTQEQWIRVMGGSNNPSYFKGGKLPVESVSWNDVQEFILRLNTLTGKKYRLPTEAEWEYAAHGGQNGKGYKYSGSNNVGNVAWYNVNSGDKVLRDGSFEEFVNKDDFDGYNKVLTSNKNRTHPVGTKLPNELGLYDMSGNVWEWVSGWYASYTSSAQTNPTGPSTGSSRVGRGGGWSYGARGCRVSGRDDGDPDGSGGNAGFRLAVSP
jgi:formylglycine-generating enzyme required for sulfatase activity